LKKAGNKLVLFTIPRDANDMPEYAGIMDLYTKIQKDIVAGRICSAYAIERNGLAEAVSKMAFGNGLGVKIRACLDAEKLFSAGWGNIVAEVPADLVDALEAKGSVVGRVLEEKEFVYGDMKISMEEALEIWNAPLEKVFPTQTGAQPEAVESKLYDAKEIYVCKHKVAKPTVFIPVFPGTNCEYDSTKAFERAGAQVITQVFKNMTPANIRDSVDEFVKCIQKAQIIMFPGGFSAGDEPEGSAKFFATAFRNNKVKDAVEELLQKRDGLMLGICNGFQALIKLGLVPYGTITEQTEDSPTLTYNTIGRHVSKMVYTKVVTNHSPWLAQAKLGDVYCNPASHGEGRFVASKEWIDKLMANGQIATQYVDADGVPTMDEFWNPNGSYCAIEGITSPDGRILGKMAHSERRGDSVAINIYGEQDMKLFESGVAYFS
jgi:phosphoribosylformylglycinamidine synthase